MTTTRATRLAEFITGLRYDDLPAVVVERAKLCLLDQLGNQLVGATLPPARIALGFVRGIGGTGDSTVVYHGDRTGPAQAAYANAVFGHSCEFDDAHFYGGHPSVCAVPPAVALAEHLGLSGRDLLTAIVAGYEVAVRSCREVHREILARGWHSTKVVGGFAAAAVAARLLGLDTAATANALAIAGSEASGTEEYDQTGGEVKRFHPAQAVRSGVDSALLAQAGLTGPPTVFEGKRGVMRLFGGEFTPDPDWGSRWEILDGIFKLYPAVGTVHAPIDALRDLVAAHGFSHRDVARISVGLADWAIPHGAAITRPHDPVSAQFSLAFSLALHLVNGGNDLRDYLDPACWTDPDIVAVADVVEAYPKRFAPGEPELGAALGVTLTDGRVLTRERRAFRGHPEEPATAGDLVEKFLALATPVLGRAGATSLLSTVQNCEDLTEIAPLTALLRRPAVT